MTSAGSNRSAPGIRPRTARPSVAKLAWDGLSSMLGIAKIRPMTSLHAMQGRSFPEAVPQQWPEQSEESDITARVVDTQMHSDVAAGAVPTDVEDDVFFDNKSHGTSRSTVDVRLSGAKPLPAQATSVSPLMAVAHDMGAALDGDFPEAHPQGGWRDGRKPPMVRLPSTPGYDYPDFGGRIVGKVVESVMQQSHQKRQFGEGLVGRVFRRTLRSDYVSNREVKQQLDDMNDHRPFFTYWVTFVQIVVYIVSVSVYGIAPIGFQKSITSKPVLVTGLYEKVVPFEEPENFWIGPRQADLIHLGAKYSPCMRKDPHIVQLLEAEKVRENQTACCRYDDGSGCFQSQQEDCPETRATWYKWDRNSTSKSLVPVYTDDTGQLVYRTSGSVCHQDPRTCTNPHEATSPWLDDITRWPVCKKTSDSIITDIDFPHIKCKLLSRPCCIGVKGECRILTEEHCSAKKGYFHADATLCSQVNCLGRVCGMIQFANPENPDQVYRMWLSLFLHAGLFHLILTCIFQFVIMRDMEKLAGAARMACIYLGAGMGGNLASSIFLPYHVEVGPAGAQFGILACLFVEVCQSWQLINKPAIALFKLGAFVLVLFLIGLLPWIDNYAHLFGFIFGLFLSFALLPYVTFGKPDRTRKLVGVALSVITVVAGYTTLFLVFYLAPIRTCEACRYFNCIPFTKDFCADMGVQIDNSETQFEWEKA